MSSCIRKNEMSSAPIEVFFKESIGDMLSCDKEHTRNDPKFSDR